MTLLRFRYVRSAAHLVNKGRHLTPVISRRRVSSFSKAVGGDDTIHKFTGNLVLGCVCYDPSVSDIWTGIQLYLKTKGVSFDFVMFPNYQSQVRALLSSRIDLAWNGPIAHVMCEELAPIQDTVVSLGMRDVDRDFQSVVVVRKDSDIRASEDLNDRHFVTGASDSPQANVVPLHQLFTIDGVQPASVAAMDLDLGKHGDTAVGEVEALKVLSETHKFDVAVVSRLMWDRAVAGKLAGLDSALVQETCQILDSVQIQAFDHCQFDALLSSKNEGLLNSFGEAILGMDMNDPKQGPIMKLEGIEKRWVGPRQSGYDVVRRAMGVSKHHRPASNFQYRTFSASRAAPSEKPTPRTSSQFSCAVIGAGVSGLQAIRALKGRGFPITAFEASSGIGGLWKKNYANVGVQVPKQLYEFQDFPMDSVQKGEYATGPQVCRYIEDYANAFGLRDAIQFETRVVSAAQMTDGTNRWNIGVETDGKVSMQVFDYLVVATGLYSGLNKLFPEISGLKDKFRGSLVHSCDFTDSSEARNKRVVVIGGGKSAVDCAIEASRSGATSVTLVQREAHWPTPRKIAGLIPFQYIFLSRFGTTLVSAHQGSYPDGQYTLGNMGRHIVKPVFRAVEELFALQFGLRGDLRPKEDVVADFYNVALVLNSDFKTLREKHGGVKVRLGEIREVKDDGHTLVLKDGTSVEADLIVSATGYDQNFDIFDDATLRALDIQRDGLFLHRYILPEKVPNLAFIGYVAAISNISSYGLQAEWLARNLTGELLSGATPNHEEIEERKAWARSWMPETVKRGMLVLLHQTQYHDQLLRDMGENPHRKSNLLAEYLMPYEPADYNGIMSGSLEKSKTI